jgi:DNA polymerase-3 subunit delta'
MALKDILGQEQAIEILRGSILKNRIAHAYIFTGDDGIGKKLTAINFAKALNCEKNRNALSVMRDELKNNAQHAVHSTQYEIDCCDKCSSCIRINKASHPDVFFIEPDNGQIKVEVIRALERSLSYKAFEGNWKIAIIDSADALNQSAANAFLKTLEEPPAHSLLVLVSSMPELIPATIRSRCQKINFLPLPLFKISELIEHRRSSETEDMKGQHTSLLGVLSGGRAGWALNKNLIEKRDMEFNKFKNLLHGIEDNLWEDRDSMEEWFDWVHLWLRDIAVFKATGRADLLINFDKEKDIENISQKTGVKDILILSNTLYNIREALRFNLNKQLTLNHTYFLLKKTFG